MGKPPYNKIRLWLTNNPFYMLLFYWLLIYLLLAAMFAFFYALADQRAVGKAFNTANLNWIGYLHFSFTTQATVGYGDLYPVSNLARFLAAVQAIVGVILNALILGLTTYKFIKRSSSIAIADKLVYNPVEHNFFFRFINWDADEIRDLSFESTIFRKNPDPKGKYSTVYREVALDYKTTRWLPTIHLFSLQSVANGGQNQGEVIGFSETDPDLPISPLNIDKDITVRLYISGYFQSTGDAIYERKDYKFDEIQCGNRELIKKEKTNNLPRKKKVDYILERFNLIISTNEDYCRKCPFFKQKCPLDVATKIREMENKSV